MKIEEAIERINNLATAFPSRIDPDEYDALKLGIEAIKRLADARKSGYYGLDDLLPGETTEDERR